MNYLYGPDRDYTDYAPGRALRGGAGRPNFPVRLALELYGRGAAALGRTPVRLWDPLCGGGSLLFAAALLGEPAPEWVLGSDADEGAVDLARENLALLTPEGCARRRAQIEEHLRAFGRQSFAEALESLDRIAAQGRGVRAAAAVYDVFSGAVPDLPVRPNLVVCDLPYGDLVDWRGGAQAPGAAFLPAIGRHLEAGAVVVACMDKRQQLEAPGFVRLDRQQVGKRRFAVYQRE